MLISMNVNISTNVDLSTTCFALTHGADTHQAENGSSAIRLGRRAIGITRCPRLQGHLFLLRHRANGTNGAVSNPFERSKSLLRGLIELHPVLLKRAAESPRRPRPAPPTAVLEAVTHVSNEQAFPCARSRSMPPPNNSSDAPSSGHRSEGSSPPAHSETIIASPESDAGSIRCVSNTQRQQPLMASSEEWLWRFIQ